MTTAYLIFAIIIAACVAGVCTDVFAKEDHIVPEAFTKHANEEKPEVDASKDPLGWWITATLKK